MEINTLFQMQSISLGYTFPRITQILVKKGKLRVLLPFIAIYPFSLILKKHLIWKFTSLIDISVFDRSTKQSRFGIVFHLQSSSQNYKVQLITFIREQTILYSLTSLFKSANWVEREVWDMFGIYFKGHPDLRRILNDYTFSWFPLKKDFPLVGYYELFYNDVTKIFSVVSVNLLQELRKFTFVE